MCHFQQYSSYIVMISFITDILYTFLHVLATCEMKIINFSINIFLSCKYHMFSGLRTFSYLQNYSSRYMVTLFSFNYKFSYFKIRMCQIMFCHFLLKCLYQARKVSDHVYVRQPCRIDLGSVSTTCSMIFWSNSDSVVSFSLHFYHLTESTINFISSGDVI